MVSFPKVAVIGGGNQKSGAENEILKLLVYFVVMVFCFYGCWFMSVKQNGSGHYYRFTFSHMDRHLFGPTWQENVSRI